MTILDKDVSRESLIRYDNREIQVTLTTKQTIDFKLKGMKSGIISIPIEQLYLQLIGKDLVEDSVIEKVLPELVPEAGLILSTLGNPMVPLYTLRTKNLVEAVPLEMKIYFEKIIVEALHTEKKRLSDLEAIKRFKTKTS